MSQVGCFREHKNEGQDGQPSQPPYMKAQPEVAKQRRQEPETGRVGRVVRDWENRHRWLYRVLAPPRPVYANPREKEIETDYPLGRWNLYIGGAGNRVPGYVNVDLVGLPGVTVVGNAEALPFASHRFTRVECDAVLEHVEQPDRVIAEIDRCLEPGGLAHFVVPFCHPLHEYPRDFRRFTPYGLKLLCANLEVVAEGWRSGPTATWLVFHAGICQVLVPQPSGPAWGSFLAGVAAFPSALPGQAPAVARGCRGFGKPLLSIRP